MDVDSTRPTGRKKNVEHISDDSLRGGVHRHLDMALFKQAKNNRKEKGPPKIQMIVEGKGPVQPFNWGIMRLKYELRHCSNFSPIRRIGANR